MTTLTTSDTRDALTHENVLIVRGRRSSLPIMIAIHSSRLGQAIGGCRMSHYDNWRLGLEDALLLSEAMTLKNAVAGLPHGGGKTVVALSPGRVLTSSERIDALLDVGEAVESLAGTYATGPDVGTSPEDMTTIAKSTSHVCCLPVGAGGSGNSSLQTAAGVMAAIRAVAAEIGETGIGGLTVGVLGLGSVGSLITHSLKEAGCSVVVSDIDTSRRSFAEQVGAQWLTPDELLISRFDILVPAAMGGLLTSSTVASLACRAIVGPANNQLAGAGIAEQLHEHGILWIPDFVVSAGGAIYASGVELRGETHGEAFRRVEQIGETVSHLVRASREQDQSPATAAHQLAALRLTDPAGAL